MPEPGAPGREDELLRRMRELEARVSSLEQRVESGIAAPGGSADTPAQPARAAWDQAIPAVTTLGRALLGIAGAYVLRAATESRLVPQRIGVFAAVVYAVLWLMWAARTAAAGRVQRALSAVTSALILGPLLWEATLRFRSLSTWTAAGILFAVTLFGCMIAWRKNLLMVSSIGTIAGVLTATALLVGTHDIVPFLVVLFGIAAAREILACVNNDESNDRWITGAAADLTLLLAIYLITLPRGLPESYAYIPRFAVVAAAVALPGIYLSSTLFRTLRRGSRFGLVEAGQLAIAVILAVGGGLRLGDPITAAGIGAACLVYSTVCYAALPMSTVRSIHPYLVFGLLLAIAGMRMLLTARWTAVACLGFAVIFLRARSPAVRRYGSAYLLLALAFSGALAQAGGWLLGNSHDLTGILPLAAAAAAALGCFAVSVREPGRPVLRMVLAGMAFWQSAGFAAAVLSVAYHAGFGAGAPHGYCATFRTVVLAAGAVLIAWAGSHWKGLPVTPLIYPVMVLGAYRLLMLDLRQDSKSALVLSLLAYGAALILVPRLAEFRQTAAR